MFTNRFHPVKPHLVRKEKVMTCKCPQCGGVAPDVENADWVIDGQPYCSLEHYDKAIQEALEEMYQNGTFPTFDMAFHLG
jgi:hypothetical protein